MSQAWELTDAEADQISGDPMFEGGTQHTKREVQTLIRQRMATAWWEGADAVSRCCGCPARTDNPYEGDAQ